MLYTPGAPGSAITLTSTLSIALGLPVNAVPPILILVTCRTKNFFDKLPSTVVNPVERSGKVYVATVERLSGVAAGFVIGLTSYHRT